MTQEKSEVLVKGHLRPLGGSWWKCVFCGNTVQAECECCEPSGRCGCDDSVMAHRRILTAATIERIKEVGRAAGVYAG
jgi:hypothetical protein